MPNRIHRNLGNRVAILFLNVYSIDGFQHKDDLKNSSKFLNLIHHTNTTTTFSVKILIALATFFGLPHRLGHHANAREEEKLTLKRLFLNFMGWPDEHDPYMSTFRKYIMKIFAIFPLIGFYHFLIACLQTIWNIAKLGTEFLPGLALLCTETGKNNILQQYNDKFLNGFGAFEDWLAFSIYYLAKPIEILGMALTSPKKSFHVWYEKGLKVTPKTHDEIHFSSISIGLTCLGYSFIFSVVFRMFALSHPELMPNVASTNFINSEALFWWPLILILAAEFAIICSIGLVGSIIKALISQIHEQQVQATEESVKIAPKMISPTSHPKALSLLIQHSPRQENKTEEKKPYPPKNSVSTLALPPKVNREVQEVTIEATGLAKDKIESSVHSIAISQL